MDKHELELLAEETGQQAFIKRLRADLNQCNLMGNTHYAKPISLTFDDLLQTCDEAIETERPIVCIGDYVPPGIGNIGFHVIARARVDGEWLWCGVKQVPGRTTTLLGMTGLERNRLLRMVMQKILLTA